MIQRAVFKELNFRQTSSSCVLASYAVASYAFTKIPIIGYFKDYCNHYGICVPFCSNRMDKLEELYNKHFHEICDKPKCGYRIIEDLYKESSRTSFVRARNHFSMEFIQDADSEINNIENRIKSGDDILLMLFVNSSSDESYIKSSHSITIGHDTGGYFIYDVNVGKIDSLRYDSLSSIGKLGNAFLIVRKTTF